MPRRPEDHDTSRADPASYRRFVALLLMAAYTFNSMDRSIVSILASAIKSDLKLTDTELGVLGGSAFAALYAVGGIAIARLAERRNRVQIISCAMTVWSMLTASCGLAGNFLQFALIRVGVGVAEAGCSPPAHSLISDYFPPTQRSTGLSIYSCGISLGYILAALVGGYLAQRSGWRTACIVAGIPGIVVALSIRLLVREPARGAADAEATYRTDALRKTPARRGIDTTRRVTWRGELAELRAVAAALLADAPIRHMVLGITLGGFAAYGLYAFIPPYFNRAFELGYADAGRVAALTGGVAVGLGILAGGFLADSLARHGARWYALVPAAGGFLSLPLYAAAILSSEWRSAAWALGAAGFCWYASLGPTFGVVQNVAGIGRRATASALLYIALSVIALGLGPLLTGWAIDAFAQHLTTTGMSFAASCPGGHAAMGDDSVCRTTLALATRRGLLVTLVFFGWASVHYLLAATGLAHSLQAAAARNAQTR